MQSLPRVFRYTRFQPRRLGAPILTIQLSKFHYTRTYSTLGVEDEMGKEKDKVSYQLKVPKGTKDWEGRDMVIRDKIFGTITEVFKRHGAVTIDTLVNNLSYTRWKSC